MDLLLDRSFQRSVPLKVPTLKSGKKSDPSPSCTDIGCEIMYRTFRGNSLFQMTNNHESGMSGGFNLEKRAFKEFKMVQAIR